MGRQALASGGLLKLVLSFLSEQALMRVWTKLTGHFFFLIAAYCGYIVAGEQ